MLFLPALGMMLMLPPPPQGSAPPSGIFGTFTKFEVDKSDDGSGDISGYEVLVLPGVDYPPFLYVVFQCAVGDVEPPVLVPAKVEGQGISFDIPAVSGEFCPGHYVARLKGNALMMTHGDETVSLPRGRSYWAPKVATGKAVAH
jgi:hypothetical protein